MNEFHSRLIKKFWRDVDPFSDLKCSPLDEDLQGWGSTHPYLSEAITTLRPQLVIEIGVWKGGSSIFMAEKLREFALDSALISVDTWLGSSEHWIHEPYFRELNKGPAIGNIYKQFLSNVIAHDLTNYIVPLPLDSINAAVLIKSFELEPDLIHIDAGHDFRSVMADLEEWWPKLRIGGQLIGDDYYETRHWPEVKEAFHAFFGRLGIREIENKSGKCRINKSS